MNKSIAILDFGSQFSQLIARRVREQNIYCELFPYDAPAEKVNAIQPGGYILSGGPASVYAEGAPQVPDYILDSGLPVLGICYGMQAITHALGGQVDPSSEREFGVATVTVTKSNPLLGSVNGPLPASPEFEKQNSGEGQNEFPALMSHGDRITRPPEGFVPLAISDNSPVAAMGDLERNYYGVQFHPEVNHTPSGGEMLRKFAVEICGVDADWTAENIIDEKVAEIRKQVGDARVLAAVSGGVDSSVAAALVHKAIGDQLVCVYVDTGLMRMNESDEVVSAFREHLGAELIAVDAEADFLGALAGETDPEKKRRIVGEKFIRIFEEQAKSVGQPQFLVQGTIYPDVVESSAPDRNKAAKIKSHHNVGGLPEDMQFELVEPLRYLFKDEVRLVGEALGLPEKLVWRQPFPGPGLTVRCLGEVTKPRVSRLRKADAILLEELSNIGMIGKGAETSQAFAVLLPVRSVGVMGDQRTYQEAVAIRAVTTSDFMTAEWTPIPHEALARISSRIVNEVEGINRVVYDITSKPPATIEWE